MKLEESNTGSCSDEADDRAANSLQCTIVKDCADSTGPLIPTHQPQSMSQPPGNYCKADAISHASDSNASSPEDLSNQTAHDSSSLHPLLPSTSVSPVIPGNGNILPNVNQQQQQQQQAIVNTGGGSTGGSEVELARRLGVRFDSSNAAWVARWVEPHTEKKKSRWFSVAKYGELPARRLAIRACLDNMKPSDFPSLRDLQDVLQSYATNPIAAAGSVNSFSHGLVSGVDMAQAQNMPNVGRGGVMDPHGLGAFQPGAKLPPQYLHHQVLQHPFAGMHSHTSSAMANYMAAVAAGAIPLTSPATAAQLNGMFCQGVPQQQAAPGFCLTAEEGGVESLPAHIGKAEDPCNMQEPHWNTMELAGQMEGHEGGPCKQVYDPTTSTASSVGSPGAGGIKMEGGKMSQENTGGSAPPGVMNVGPLDQNVMVDPMLRTPAEQVFLQSLSGTMMTGPQVPTGYMMPEAGSSQGSSSDLDTRSAVSDEDEDEDDLDSQEKEHGSEFDRADGKSRKRKREASGSASTSLMPLSPAQQAQHSVPFGIFGGAANGLQGGLHPPYYSLYPSFGHQHPLLLHQLNGGAANPSATMHTMPFLPPGYPLSLLHPSLHPHHSAATGFMSHLDMSAAQGSGVGMYLQGGHYPQQQLTGAAGPVGDSPQSQTTSGSPTSATSPGVDSGGASGAFGQGSGANANMSAKMTCERGLHYSKCYRGSQECWIAVWNTKGGRIMHEAFDVAQMGFDIAKSKAREARDAAHSNNIAVSENSRPSWKSHSNTGIPHVSLDSQQLRFRAHKFGRRLCRSFSFGRRRGSYASRESAFDAAVLWLIQTPTDDEIAAVSGISSNRELDGRGD